MDRGPLGTGSDERLSMLASFGLSGYQARAYLALLELGPAQAREVSERSGVPQGRVYDVLEKLHERGLAEVLPEAPRRYRAVPFEVFLERELELHRQKVGILERDREQLVKLMAPAQGAAPPVERGEYVVVRGRKTVSERIAALVGGTHRDLLLLGTERSAERIKGDAPLWGELLARGATPRLLLPVTDKNRAHVQEVLSLGLEVRHHGGLGGFFPPGLHVLIADGSRALLYQHQPDDLDLVRGDDVGLFIEHPEMVRGLKALGETIWSIAFPATERLEDLARAGGEPAAAGQAVLLVDDEPDILQSMRELLEGSLKGVRVRATDSGPAALDILAKEPVDLIITDYRLPGMNGIELLSEAGKAAQGVPRILITAFPDLKVALRAINEARVEHFLTKPFQPRQLVDVVRGALARRAEQSLRNRLLARAVETEGKLPPAG